MTIRTTNQLTNPQTALNLQRIKERMAVLTQQITSGKRIVNPGDDPTGSALIVDFRNSIARNDQYSSQIDSASSMLKFTEDSLTGVSDDLMRVMEMAVQAQGTSVTAAMRAALVPEAQGLRASIIGLANQQDQGKYLFAGTKTTTQPFSDASVNPTTYSGDSNSITLDVSMGTSITTNLPGDAVFLGSGAPATDVFQQMSDFIDGLTTNDSVKIKGAADNLNAIFAGVQAQIAVVGGRQATLDQIKTTLGNFNSSLASIQDSYESVDYAKAVTEYQSQSVSQQASLNMMAKGNAQNLFNYLT